MRRSTVVVLTAGHLLAAAVGALMVALAFDHNPQGSFHECSEGLRLGCIHWDTTGGLFLSWTFATAGVFVWVPGLVALLASRLRARRRGGDEPGPRAPG